MIELNKVYNKDCLEFMKEIPDEYIDLIIADPPYYQILKTSWDNQWETEKEYYDWCKKLLKEFKRIIKSNGSIYIWNWYDNICSIGHFAKEEGFIIRNLITWNRGAGREKNNWCSAKEDLLNLTLTDKPTFNLKDVLLPLDDPNRKMKKSSWERCKYERKGRKNFEDNKVNPSNVWFDSFIHKVSNEWVDHPSQKPLSICERIVKASSNVGDIVYIPFAGSGSEIIACIKNKRNYIATEINNEYITNIIIPRIQRYTPNAVQFQ